MSGFARPPFRADHVGSLLRPSTLKTLRDDVAARRRSAAALRAAEDVAIRDVVALQLDDVSLAYLCDDDMRAQSRAMGEDPDAVLVRGEWRPRGARVGAHPALPSGCPRRGAPRRAGLGCRR